MSAIAFCTGLFWRYINAFFSLLFTWDFSHRLCRVSPYFVRGLLHIAFYCIWTFYSLELIRLIGMLLYILSFSREWRLLQGSALYEIDTQSTASSFFLLSSHTWTWLLILWCFMNYIRLQRREIFALSGKNPPQKLKRNNSAWASWSKLIQQSHFAPKSILYLQNPFGSKFIISSPDLFTLWMFIFKQSLVNSAHPA